MKEVGEIIFLRFPTFNPQKIVDEECGCIPLPYPITSRLQVSSKANSVPVFNKSKVPIIDNADADYDS